MQFIPFLLLLLLWNPSDVKSQTDNLYTALNTAIEKSQAFDSEKLQRIENLKKTLSRKHYKGDANDRYLIYLKLFDEYESFNYDSTYLYANKLEKLGIQLNDAEKIGLARIKLGFILITSGRYKESFDYLNSVNVKILHDSVKADYYFTRARNYFDLGAYNDDEEFTPKYNKIGGMLIDSGIVFCDPNSFRYTFNKGDKALHNGEPEKALHYFKRLLLNTHHLTQHEIARTAAGISGIYSKANNPEEAKRLIIISAIADCKSSTKETTSTYILSQYLYKENDLDRAYYYINHAMDNANVYGSKLRGKLKKGRKSSTTSL